MFRKKEWDKHYWEVLEELKKSGLTKYDYRRIHKELKLYGDGMPAYTRYPDLPMIMSCISGLAVIVAFVVTIIRIVC